MSVTDVDHRDHARRVTVPLIPDRADNASASASTAYTCAGPASIVTCC
jgi:hypothetical protein